MLYPINVSYGAVGIGSDVGVQIGFFALILVEALTGQSFLQTIGIQVNLSFVFAIPALYPCYP